MEPTINKRKFDHILDELPKKECSLCNASMHLFEMPKHLKTCLKEFEAAAGLVHECCCKEVNKRMNNK